MGIIKIQNSENSFLNEQKVINSISVNYLKSKKNESEQNWRHAYEVGFFVEIISIVVLIIVLVKYFEFLSLGIVFKAILSIFMTLGSTKTSTFKHLKRLDEEKMKTLELHIELLKSDEMKQVIMLRTFIVGPLIRNNDGTWDRSVEVRFNTFECTTVSSIDHTNNLEIQQMDQESLNGKFLIVDFDVDIVLSNYDTFNGQITEKLKSIGITPTQEYVCIDYKTSYGNEFGTKIFKMGTKEKKKLIIGSKTFVFLNLLLLGGIYHFYFDKFLSKKAKFTFVKHMDSELNFAIILSDV